MVYRVYRVWGFGVYVLGFRIELRLYSPRRYTPVRGYKGVPGF